MVSIIIPAYNCARWLSACLDSVRAQTCPDWEAFVVDDGSTDGTGEIAERYAAQDGRITVIHQKNAGSSVARNTGLDRARGEYVYMLDGDDYVHPRLLEHCLAAFAAHPGTDFATFDFAEVVPGAPAEYAVQEGKTRKIANPLAFWLHTRRDHSVWMNVYRTSSLRGLRFKPGIKHQDLLFQYQYLATCGEGVYLSEHLYRYVMSPNSIMRAPLKVDRIETIFDILTQLDDFYAGQGRKRKSLRRCLYPRIVNAYRKDVSRAEDPGKRGLQCAFDERLTAFLNKRRMGFAGLSLRKRLWLLRFMLQNCPQGSRLAKFVHCICRCEHKRKKNVYHVLGLKFTTHPAGLDFTKTADPARVLANLFERLVGYRPDLENPQTFNEKIQWQKLHRMANAPYPALADKWTVRAYVADRIGEKYLTKMHGCYRAFEEIDFAALPRRFVLKPNHGSGWYKLVADKDRVDIPELKRLCDGWLKEDFSRKEYELQYRSIPRRLLVEEYLGVPGHSLTDYKIFCFNGKARYAALYFDRSKNGTTMCYYDKNWKKQPFFVNYRPHKDDVPKPPQMDELFELAEKLAEGFPFVRVDFYILPDGDIKFGELTFTPASGFGRYRRIVDGGIVGDYATDYALGQLLSQETKEPGK